MFEVKERGGGALHATRPTLDPHIATREELVAAADATFAALSGGKFRLPMIQSYASEGCEARARKSRRPQARWARRTSPRDKQRNLGSAVALPQEFFV